MGNPTGFMRIPRRTAPCRPVAERIGDYREITGVLDEQECARQGERCMDCGIPFCHALGCPVRNLVPEFNDLVYRGQWRDAYIRLSRTNPLPEITGRICPAPCEAACTLSINSSPVAIKSIELAIIERAFREGWVAARPPARSSGKNVAIVGSGPAGLAAAGRLARSGHAVVVFEKSDRPGGILRYGIPDFKLEKQVLDRRLDILRAEGVRFESDVVVGEDLSVRYLRRGFDAVLLAIGAGAPRDLYVPGRGLEGIHFAMEYLAQSNRRIAGDTITGKNISARDKRVLVIGGGDTGADCVGTAIRQRAGAVYQYEIMPRPRSWDQPYNPSWPHWPSILRTGTSHEEGCEREWGVATKQFSGQGVQVRRGHFVRVHRENRGRDGAPVMTEIPESEFTLDVDLVLLAMGFEHVEHSPLLTALGVGLNERGNIRINGDYATTVPGIFAAGDAGLGASLVVRAIFQGWEAARAIDSYLKGVSS